MDMYQAPNSEHLGVMPRDFVNCGQMKLSAVAEHAGIRIKIDDDFAAYLAQRNNNELREYLNAKAEEIVRFVACLEKRVNP